MFKIILTLFLSLSFFASNLAYGIEPGARGPDDPSDSFFTYQWGLKASGQSEDRDITDIQSTPISVDPNATIGWSFALSQKMQKEVIVAVIDSGLDVNHPDIKNQILKNEIECDQGFLQPAPAKDRDNNGFPGDCMGYSFIGTGRRELPAHLVIDEIGHGTHVSGIIAAEVNNGLGIAGISNKIKLLPLKVYDPRESTEVPAGRRIPVPQRVASAIDYAILRGADVINLSMGWPLFIHSDLVKKSIQNAIQKGVFVVAGAGNDNHDAPIYPCAEIGVICVGSIDMDLEQSAYSNYGGQIDLFAPGKSILSIYPMDQFSFFGPIGYQVLSGTSQAAPFVSGAIALLKGAFPTLPNNEIKRRLLNQKHLSLPKLMDSSISKYSVFPIFKGNRLISANVGEEITVPILIENLSSKNQELKIQIKTPRHPMLFANEVTRTVKPGVNSINLSSIRKLTSTDDSQLGLKIGFSDGRVFEHSLTLAQNVDSVLNKKIFNLESKANVSTMLQYPADPKQDEPIYYTTEKIGENLNVIVHELKKDSTLIKKEALLVNTLGLSRSLPAIAVDMNSDNKKDYIFFGVHPSAEDRTQDEIIVSMLKDDMSPLFGGSNQVRLQSPHAAISIPSLRFLRQSTSYGNFLLPAFFSYNGFVPEEDKNPNYFDFENQYPSPNIYVLHFTSFGNARLRLVTNYLWREQLDRTLDLQYPRQLSVHAPLLQNKSSFAAGRLEVIVSEGLGTDRNFFVVEIADSALQPLVMRPIQMASRMIRFQAFDPVLDLRSDDGIQNAITEVYSSTGFRTVVLNEPQHDQFSEEVVMQLTNEANPIISILQVAKINGNLTVALERADHFSIIKKKQSNSELVVAESPIYRTGYLPGELFTLSYAPIVMNVGGEEQMGFFVDNSLVFLPQILTWYPDESNQMNAPLKFSIQMPPNCGSKNPVRFSGQSQMVIQCQDKLIFFPVQ